MKFVLSFYMESWELATALKEAKPRFDAAGVKLIAVGVGTPDKARILATRVRSFSIFLDIYQLTQLMDMFYWDILACFLKPKDVSFLEKHYGFLKEKNFLLSFDLCYALVEDEIDKVFSIFSLQRSNTN